ncbi:nucleotidyltransferase [Tenacibaculum maritimum]|uniref:nucleotidyltransferase n=1 Tax=Tenacibaculum maritimum TaxID=107401 RepID=UPI0038766E47
MDKIVEEYQNKMIVVKENEPSLSELTSTSKVSIWRQLLFIVATCMVDLRTYFTAHREYVDKRLANQKAGTLPWYRSMTLAFQYGFDLIEGTDKFENNNATEEEINASKIIKYAAVNEGEVNGSVVVKIATETNGKLSPIQPEVVLALKEYFKEIKWVWDDLVIINHLADKLFLNIRIYRDPLVLNAEGMSILKGNKPVEQAIQEFMKELPFDGELILQNLIDKLQKVDGVKIAHLVEAKSSSLNPNTSEHGIASRIEVKRIPESGYFEIETFENIEYVV